MVRFIPKFFVFGAIFKGVGNLSFKIWIDSVQLLTGRNYWWLLLQKEDETVKSFLSNQLFKFWELKKTKQNKTKPDTKRWNSAVHQQLNSTAWQWHRCVATAQRFAKTTLPKVRLSPFPLSARSMGHLKKWLSGFVFTLSPWKHPRAARCCGDPVLGCAPEPQGLLQDPELGPGSHWIRTACGWGWGWFAPWPCPRGFWWLTWPRRISPWCQVTKQASSQAAPLDLPPALLWASPATALSKDLVDSWVPKAWDLGPWLAGELWGRVPRSHPAGRCYCDQRTSLYKIILEK